MQTEINKKLAKANEDLAAAQHLLSGGFVRAAMNRCYYAIFHAANAALVRKGGATEHIKIKERFIAFYVKTEKLPAAFADYINRAASTRSAADYKDDFDLHKVQPEQRIAEAKRFIIGVEELLKEMGGPKRIVRKR